MYQFKNSSSAIFHQFVKFKCHQYYPLYGKPFLISYILSLAKNWGQSFEIKQKLQYKLQPLKISSYRTQENFGREKQVNLASRELFAKIFLTNIHRYSTLKMYLAYALPVAYFSSPIALICMIHQNFLMYSIQYVY